MTESMTIGELARAAGVPASTVRYYERAGLLRPTGRSGSNYRLYTREELKRLGFIRAAQATGFTLAHVRQLLRPAPCGRVQGMIEERLGDVSAQMAELRHVQRVLHHALELCREHEKSGRCGAIDSIASRAADPRARKGRSRGTPSRP